MTSALRIGIIVPRFPPFRGGVETYVSSAASALAAEGADVTVITQAPRSAALPRIGVNDGYAIERHALPIGEIFDVPSLSAARQASRRRFDVLWVHSYHTPLAWLAAEQAASPVVFTPHYHGVGHTPLRRALHRGYRPAGRRLMAASARIIVDTVAEADLVLRDFPRQVQRDTIAVIPPIVADPLRGREPVDGGANVVLSIARQEAYKRTDLLIRAVVQLRDRGVAARLVVVGDGAALPSHRDLTTRLGGHDVVTFTGAVGDEELQDWWASASLYATASEQEAYGIGFAQALLSGLPVVASDIPAHRDVVRSAGPGAAVRLCGTESDDNASADDYAAAISDLLATTTSRAQRAAGCGLPGAREVTLQLLDTLSTVSRTVGRV